MNRPDDSPEIKAALASRAEEFCRHILPNGRNVKGKWTVGGLDGAAGQSMVVDLAGPTAGRWHDFATDEGGGNLLELLVQRRRVPFAHACIQARDFLGMSNAIGEFVPPSPPFNWSACVEAFTDAEAQKLAQWRGFSLEFVRWLHGHSLIGLHRGSVALPVPGGPGGHRVLACHYRGRKEDAKGKFPWFFYPEKIGVRALVLGNPATANLVHVFESQWDAFAVCDRQDLHEDPQVALVITRGASNGRLAVEGLNIQPGTMLHAWKQNDEAGEKWLAAVAVAAASKGFTVREVVTPPEHKDPNDWTRAGADAVDLLRAANAAPPVTPPVDLLAAGPTNADTACPRCMVEFLTPSALREFSPPAGWNIVGDYHVQRAAPFVIGGPSGTGKSRALIALAVAGATGQPWFGLPVQRRFRTMVLQCENGRVRLKNETSDLPDGLDEWVRVSPPPPFGFAFNDPEFLAQLRAAVEAFKPDVFALDPWNRLARDDRGKDYKEAFEAILSALPPGDDCPAIGIVAHTRKPQTGERANGRALLNLLAGSYVLGSVPRSAFILQPASDEGDDDRVVFTVTKNNDGLLGSPSAWQRRNGLFAPCADFDWDEFNAGPENATRATVTEEHMEALFNAGKRRLSTGEAVRLLMEQTGFKKTACYTALKPGGRFGTRLVEASGLLRWKAATNV